MDSPEPTLANAPSAEQPASRRPRFFRGTRTGQATVEFAIVSIAFMMLVFGTIDFGRAIFMYSQLHNAVREGARYGKINPAQTTNIKNVVIDNASSLDLAAGDINVSCTGGCYPGCADVTVEATGHFQAITQELLGISPIDLHSSATVGSE